MLIIYINLKITSRFCIFLRIIRIYNSYITFRILC
nr:MAG TPA: hypothetical protein [Caudoviricetes sp.]